MKDKLGFDIGRTRLQLSMNFSLLSPHDWRFPFDIGKSMSKMKRRKEKDKEDDG